MSKSYGNAIMLTDPEPVVRQKLKTMVTDPARIRRTDPGNPDVCPVGDLHKIFSDSATMAKVNAGCRSAGIGCIECKGWAADALVNILNPMQERRKKYEDNPRLAWDILEAGSAKAGKVASATMAEVRECVAHVVGLRGSLANRWQRVFQTAGANALAPTAPPNSSASQKKESDSPFSVAVTDVYEGPLDLLLDLIRKQDIDIYDIPIAMITAQYLAYVEKLRELDVNIAADFIYMAAVLIHIKSKMLLPRDPAAGSEEAEDPRSRIGQSTHRARKVQVCRADADAEAADRRCGLVESGDQRIHGRRRDGTGNRRRRHRSGQDFPVNSGSRPPSSHDPG